MLEHAGSACAACVCLGDQTDGRLTRQPQREINCWTPTKGHRQKRDLYFENPPYPSGYSKEQDGLEIPPIKGKTILSYLGREFTPVRSSKNELFLLFLPYFFSWKNRPIWNSSSTLFQDQALSTGNTERTALPLPFYRWHNRRAQLTPFLRWQRGLHPGKAEPTFHLQLLSNTYVWRQQAENYWREP